MMILKIFQRFASAIFLCVGGFLFFKGIQDGLDVKDRFEDITRMGREARKELDCFYYCWREMTENNQSLLNGQEREQTLCGMESWRKGINQKIISFSFYGPITRTYFGGIRENLDSLEYYYPGWRMRLYFDRFSQTKSTIMRLCKLSCMQPSLDLCLVDSLPFYGNVSQLNPMVWRFLPMGDPLVDIVMSRDLDSRFSYRETTAVSEWLSSNLTFHVMRDHPTHGNYEILGGLWGARNHLDRQKFKNLTDVLIAKTTSNSQWGIDQDLLRDVVWSQVKNETMTHDAYSCDYDKLQTPEVRPWPTRRILYAPYNFVGSQGYSMNSVCPVSCRPENNINWFFC